MMIMTLTFPWIEYGNDTLEMVLKCTHTAQQPNETNERTNRKPATDKAIKLILFLKKKLFNSLRIVQPCQKECSIFIITVDCCASELMVAVEVGHKMCVIAFLHSNTFYESFCVCQFLKRISFGVFTSLCELCYFFPSFIFFACIIFFPCADLRV